MSLEDIDEIRAEIRRLQDEREINLIEGRQALSNIRKKYFKILEKEGKEYCDKNYSDVIKKIDDLKNEFYIK